MSDATDQRQDERLPSADRGLAGRDRQSAGLIGQLLRELRVRSLVLLEFVHPLTQRRRDPLSIALRARVASARATHRLRR